MIRTNYSVFDYLAVGEVDKLWGLYVTGSGSADIPPGTSYPPEVHPKSYMFDFQHGRVLSEYQIVFISGGKGTFESKETGTLEVEEGTVLLLFPGVWHRYTPSKSTGWKEHWVSFNGTQADIFRDNAILPLEQSVISIGLDETTIELYQRILESIESERIGFKETIAALTYQLIARINAIRRSRQFGGEDTNSFVQKSKAYIRDHIDQQIDLERLASELGIGYSWFRRMFKHHTGLAPNQYVVQLKLNKAKDLLVNTALPLKQISTMLGFESQFYFSKFFRNKTGVPPTRWRSRSRTRP